jgi:hypothetical protein
MTLKETITADVTNVFLNEDEFAETVTLYPRGDVASKVEFLGVVINDNLEGTREAHGDGVVLNHNAGIAIRESIRIECAASVDISATRRPQDLLKTEDGEMWVVKRVTGRDTDGMQTVLAAKREDVTIRKPVRSG